VPLDEGERIDAARDRRDAIKAWSFILLLLALTLGALRLFWRGYSWLLFSQSTVVFIGALLYIVLFISAAPAPKPPAPKPPHPARSPCRLAADPRWLHA